MMPKRTPGRNSTPERTQKHGKVIGYSSLRPGDGRRPDVLTQRSADIELAELTLKRFEASRPVVRGDCRDEPRPCPFVSCKYHLYLDVNPSTGSIKINFPGLEVWELDHTCALDVADWHGITLGEVAELMNLTRERVRQIEAASLERAYGRLEVVKGGRRPVGGIGHDV